MEPTLSADPAVLVAQQRLARRNEARALLTSNPALTAELRIGRPGLGRQYDDGGLVDITHVSAQVIARELGISFLVAEEIVMQRRGSAVFTPLTVLSFTAGRSPCTRWNLSGTGSFSH
jgi:hypothetical protein